MAFAATVALSAQYLSFTCRIMDVEIKNIIFHIPWKLGTQTSASQIRPKRMEQAFKDAGFRVFTISGSGTDRRLLLRQLKRLVKDGERFSFFYGETATIPSLFTGGRRGILRSCLVDFRLYAFVFRKGIPAGLFVRDIYWRFKGFRRTIRPSLRRAAYRAGYLVDFLVYKVFFGTVFVPSFGMIRYLPDWFKPKRFCELPPGIRSANKSQQPEPSCSGPLRLLYAGGIGAHYSMDTLFSVLETTKHEVECSLVVRKNEWQVFVEKRSEGLPDSISVFHSSQDDLISEYQRANICLIFVRPDTYWQFAVPFKLFEYLEYGKPVIASKGTAAGTFVEKYGVGWTIAYEAAALRDLLARLSRDPTDVANCTKRVRDVASLHLWRERALAVESSLRRDSAFPSPPSATEV